MNKYELASHGVGLLGCLGCGLVIQKFVPDGDFVTFLILGLPLGTLMFYLAEHYPAFQAPKPLENKQQNQTDNKK